MGVRCLSPAPCRSRQPGAAWCVILGEEEVGRRRAVAVAVVCQQQAHHVRQRWLLLLVPQRGRCCRHKCGCTLCAARPNSDAWAWGLAQRYLLEVAVANAWLTAVRESQAVHAGVRPLARPVEQQLHACSSSSSSGEMKQLDACRQGHHAALLQPHELGA